MWQTVDSEFAERIGLATAALEQQSPEGQAAHMTLAIEVRYCTCRITPCRAR